MDIYPGANRCLGVAWTKGMVCRENKQDVDGYGCAGWSKFVYLCV